MASKRLRPKTSLRHLRIEALEQRRLFTVSPLHNTIYPEDVDADSHLSPIDALIVINSLNASGLKNPLQGEAEASSAFFPDVDNDGDVSPLDVLVVINALNAMLPIPDPDSESMVMPLMVDPDDTVLTEMDVEVLLDRASMATTSQDAIIAIVDRAGQILGVRAEQGVLNTYAGRPDALVFAVDGAVAKARTAAFFSNTQAPLTSRTVRFISQSTVTQREVESNPNIPNLDSPWRGPGFVAPIGTGGHFPPQIANTPLVDLFAIEHQSRDSALHPGLDGIKGTGDDLALTTRFNVDLNQVPDEAKTYMQLFPESYGTQSGLLPEAQSRGIATLPGGIPIYKNASQGLQLIGGIGVFFPGVDGYATHEQGFVHASLLGAAGPQSEVSRTNAPKVLESEFIAFFASGGTTIGNPNPTPVTEFEGKAPPLVNIQGVTGRIDLVGITLEIYGPHPTRFNTANGQQQLLQVGRANGGGQGLNSGVNLPVLSGGETIQRGRRVPEGWLVNPHASGVDNLSAADVEEIIQASIDQAETVRAAIRLDANFRPGARTRMVLAVADSTGEVLGLYRMPDATVFSIDVAVAKSRNTAYYASDALVPADRVDANNDGIADVPKLAAFTNRTFRFLAAPRFPTGSNAAPGDFSMLVMPGINPLTAENSNPANPLPASVYAGSNASVVAFVAFNASRNFRDPDHLENQNGVVFFPGSSALYQSGTQLVGGFGVSGDGVDQDDVVTAYGQAGFDAPTALRADAFFVQGVRLPYQKFNRNPRG
jgi:uncharacterized protein GlcG (DUF336 family)